MEDSESGLEVKQSWLSQEGSPPFMGLFATKKYAQGDVVCVYTGKVYRTSPAQALADKSYLMRIGEQCYIDARESGWVPALLEGATGAGNEEQSAQDTPSCPPCIARYINDSINPAGHNVVFQKFPLPCPYPPSSSAPPPAPAPAASSATSSSLFLSCPYPYALVVAQRPIEPGEELFVNYGKWYWAAASLGPAGGTGGGPLLLPYRIPFMELHTRRTDAVAAAAAGAAAETSPEPASVIISSWSPGTS